MRKITPETHGKLAVLNWAALSDHRAATVTPGLEIRRAALIVTGQCNFACPYCKTLGGDRARPMTLVEALDLLCYLLGKGLKHLRISGGEPTVLPWLPVFVGMATRHGARVAVSTNGYAPPKVYEALIQAGLAECSISLDTTDPVEAEALAGGRPEVLARVSANIRLLTSKGVPVYVGICCAVQRAQTQLAKTVALAASLGVTDVKIMPPSQEGDIILDTEDLKDLANKFPFLAWRVRNFQEGVGVRGLKEHDCSKCALVLDDVTIAGDYHYPCNVYFREGGEPIGYVGDNMLAERAEWYHQHDSLQDPICRAKCMDLLRAYNNRVQELQGELP